MPILNYTTEISFEKSISEITKVLVRHGAHKIVTDYKNNVPVAVTFCLTLDGVLVGFSLPAKYSGVLKAMKSDRNVPRSKCTEEQALRVSWRIIKDWTESQMALVQAELADMAEVFLPYAITKGGKTLYEHIKDDKMLMLNAG